MEKVRALLLVLIMVLACVGLVACGGGGGAAPPSGGETPSSGGELTWSDMPTYPGAKQGGQMTWATSPEEAEWQKAEWKWYETGDGQNEVVAFYQSAMPAKGWQQIGMWQVEEVSWFYYTKNNENDGAMVWIGTDEGKTAIGLMRGST